jgi:hypothetical protein
VLFSTRADAMLFSTRADAIDNADDDEFLVRVKVEPAMEWAQGERCAYKQKRPGGYEFKWFVPAIFERYCGDGTRATIRLQLARGGEKRIVVKAVNLYPRR